uniref:Chemerin vc n=1 Tax=Gallus gallus gallus TaxID=208526 RepID=A0A7S4ZCB0_CHICK|nr:chemerin vc [Gallus gallus gallus]
MQSTTGPPGPARWCQLARHGAQLLINHSVGRTEQWPVPCCPLAGHGVPFLSPPQQGAGDCGVGLYCQPRCPHTVSRTWDDLLG